MRPAVSLAERPQYRQLPCRVGARIWAPPGLVKNGAYPVADQSNQSAHPHNLLRGKGSATELFEPHRFPAPHLTDGQRSLWRCGGDPVPACHSGRTAPSTRRVSRGVRHGCGESQHNLAGFGRGHRGRSCRCGIGELPVRGSRSSCRCGIGELPLPGSRNPPPGRALPGVRPSRSPRINSGPRCRQEKGPVRARTKKRPAPEGAGLGNNGRCWTRTSDPIDVSDVLYQLS